MLVKYWRAAILAAAMVLSANAARAEDPPIQGGDCCKKKDCSPKCPKLNCDVLFIQAKEPGKDHCQSGSCRSAACKNGQGDKGKECCADKECCKGKCGACGCCCTAKTEQAKHTPFSHPIIIMVPVPMMTPPMSHVVMPQAIASQPYSVVPTAPITPPMQYQPIATPFPPPPQPGCPCPPGSAPLCCPPSTVASSADTGMDLDSCLSVLGLVADACCSHNQPASLPSMCISALGLLTDLCGSSCSQPCYVQQAPGYTPSSPSMPQAAILPPPLELPATIGQATIPASAPPMMACALACPAAPAACSNKIRIKATPYDGQLEMSIGDDACMTCKRMTVKVGDCSLTMTTADGKVRVRSTELKGWADCVQTDRKDHLILKGDVVLHYKKQGQRVQILAGEHIEMNLATGSVRIEQSASSAKPNRVGEAIRYDGIVP
jgi:hypothetical protein